jgi:pimeloyl-ACP methyl ester carboxylesterase
LAGSGIESAIAERENSRQHYWEPFKQLGAIMQHVTIGDIKLAVRTIGHQGYPLLLVHGFPLDHTMWGPQIDYFSDHCRVIAPDLRGFGGSDVTPGTVTMEQMADDLNQLLDELDVREKIILCGLSMGGYVGMQFWRKYKQRVLAMILCDTRAVADTPEAAANRHKLAALTLKSGPAEASKVMLPKMFAAQTWESQPELVQRTRKSIEKNNPEGIAAAARGLAERPDARELIKTIDVPVLVVVGEHDAISPVAEMREMADSIPNAAWLVVPDAGHMAPLEQPSVVNEAIAEFITL